jgi:uncharacterized Fe-S cluster protein YjdI
MRHEFRGSALTISYDDEVCIHAASCVRTLPSVFDADSKPWIDPDGAAVDAVTATVAGCPSGALAVTTTGSAS